MPDFEEQKLGGASRSSKWPKVRAKFLKDKACAVCGGLKELQAHHILPFHKFPTLELDPTNLLALCEGNERMNCHLLFGHFGNFATKWNTRIVREAKKWQKRFGAKTMIEI